MSKVNELFDKLEKLPLKDVLNLCAMALDQGMEKQKLETILLLAESRLMKYRTLSRLGMTPE